MAIDVQLAELLRTTKDYWFLVTLCFAVAATVFYMLVVQVTPWDKYLEIKHRREQVQFHNTLGSALLERGHYQLANSEFERALNLTPIDYTALNGRYLCELFLGLESLEWDAAVGIAVQNSLKDLGVIREKELLHFVEKYLGDLHQRITRPSEALQHYERAIAIKPEYVDALFACGWLSYVTNNLDKMLGCFEKMVGVDRYDYRGLHGLGYALYMKALRESDPPARVELLTRAAAQSAEATRLRIHQLNVLLDFGEIARSIDPALALRYHNQARATLKDAKASQLRLNQASFRYQPLMAANSSTIIFKEVDEKRAYIDYHRALDFLAQARLAQHSLAREKHDRALSDAQSLDKGAALLPVYEDQLKILDFFLPSQTVAIHGQA